MQIYIDEIKYRIAFKIKTSYKLELLSLETMKLLRRANKDADQDKDGKNVRQLESADVVLVHCILVNNNYQQASKVLFAFVPDKQFRQLITIATHSSKMLKTTNAEF